MRIKIEQLLIWSGILAATWMISLAIFHEALGKDLLEVFRGGHVGAIVGGVFLSAGFIGLVVYLVNVTTGMRYRWMPRLLVCFIFVVATGVAGNLY